MAFDPVKKTLLQVLADNRFHSGNGLAAQLGVSRTAVWKAVHELEALGLEVDAVSGRGYRVGRPLELLDAACILPELEADALQVLARLELHDELDSTNAYLLRAAADGVPAGTVCLADVQTAGRGRMGRTWLSSLGANLCLSVLWRFDDHSRIAGLSLAVGVAVARALARAGIEDIALKWPNDLLWHGRKLAGILLEVAGEAHGRCAVVVGLGLNRYISPGLGRSIDQDWADLYQIAGVALPSRNRLVALVLNELLPLLRDFGSLGLEPYLPEWRQYHGLNGQDVVIEQGDVRTRGRIADVTPMGLLLLRCEDGSLREFAAGDVRLRTAGD